MKRISLLFVIPLALGAQTTINGGRIFKGTLDASGAASTLPYRTGTGGPVGRDTCGKPGETYFQTDAPAGQNVWGCTAAGTPGTWNSMTAGASVVTGVSAPGGTCAAGALYVRTDIPQFYICSATNAWQLSSYGSGVAANKPANCVAGQVFLATDAGALWFCATPGSPGTWQVLGGALASVFGRTGAVTAQAGDYTAAQVTNAAQTNASNTFAGTQNFSGAAHTLPAVTGVAASRPATCTIGEVYFATDAAAGRNWYFCTATNTWTGTADVVPSVFGRTGAVTAQAGDYTAAQVGALNDPGSNGIVKRTAANSTGVAVAGDFPTLNQNTTGTAANVTGIVAESNGGTGANNTAGAAGHVLRSNGTHYVDSAIQAADVPTLNQSTTGNAATATALASAPTQCTGGQFATGVTSNGNANCSIPGGGGNASITATTVSFSATPTFARSTNIQEFTLTLSGNVTSSTLTGAVGNDILIFQVCQDTSGGRTFVWPSGFGLAATISPTANSCTRQQFVWDGANANPSAPATSTDSPFLISGAQERAAPATPGSGIASLWPDSTRHTWSSVENNSANAHIMPRTAGGGDQLASTDLSDSGNLARITTSNTFNTGTQDFSAAAHTLPAVKGTAASKPGTCTIGEMYFATDATAGQNWYFCTAANTWTQQLNSGSGAVSSVFGRSGAVTAQSGDYTAAQVTNAAQINASNTFTAGTQDFSGAAHTLPALKGTAAAKPAICTQGEQYFATDATAGQNLYFCTATNTWTQQVNGGGGGVTSVFGRTGAVAAQSGDYTAAQVTNAAQTNAGNTFTAGTQDHSGAAHTLPAVKGTAASIPATCTQGEEYFATDATAGRNMYYCTAANTWTQQVGGGGGGTTLATQGAGYVMPFGFMAYNVAGATSGPHDVRVYQFVCCWGGVSITVRSIRFQLSGAPASSTGLFGFYADSSGTPGSLLAITNTLATTAPGYMTATFATPYTLTLGTVYWVGFTNDTSGMGIQLSGSDTNTILGEASHPREGLCTNSSTGTGGSLAFAASCGGIGGGANVTAYPVMAFLP